MYVQMPTRRRLRGLGSGASSSWDYGYSNQDPSVGPVDTGNPLAIASAATPNTSWWDYFFPSQSGSLAAGTAQIQSVPANAAAANAAAIAAGLPPPYNVPQIQAAANQQSAAFAAEIPALWAAPPPNLKDPSTWPWYYWAALAYGGFLLVQAVKR